jgi:isopenicillin N synthase-like dioxygenase
VFPPTTESDPSPPILINIGDLLAYWTNNLFKSTVHRVVFPKADPNSAQGSQDRYSMAYFGHPVGTTLLEAIPSEMVREAGRKLERKHENGEKELTADGHLMSRLRATYLGLYRDGEEEKK